MNNGWQTRDLGDLCDVIGGGTPPKDSPNYYSGKIPWATVRDMRQEVITETEFRITRDAVQNSATNIIPSGNVVIATRVGLGKVCLLGQDTAINQDLKGIVPRDKNSLSVRFLFWWLKSVADIIVAEGTGATVQGVKLPFVKSLQIPLLPLRQQEKIVGTLDEAFEGIAGAEAKAGKNLENARFLFQNRLQSVFTARGEGWVEATIGDSCTLKSGTTVSPTLERPAGDIPYLKVADMTFDGNEAGIRSSSRFLNERDVKKSAIIPKGATIFPKRGGAILTNKKRITLTPICADLNIMAVIPSAQIYGRLLYFYFVNVDMRKLGTGSSIPQINNYDIAPLLIAVPRSLSKQRELVSTLDELQSETEHLSSVYKRKLDALAALKGSLLHKAFTGNL